MIASGKTDHSHEVFIILLIVLMLARVSSHYTILQGMEQELT